MINNLAILFSLAMVVYVVVRATFLDKKRPWFEASPRLEAVPGTVAADPRRPPPPR